jgi:hypothetical protein
MPFFMLVSGAQPGGVLGVLEHPPLKRKNINVRPLKAIVVRQWQI